MSENFIWIILGTWIALGFKLALDFRSRRAWKKQRFARVAEARARQEKESRGSTAIEHLEMELDVTREFTLPDDDWTLKATPVTARNITEQDLGRSFG